MKLFDLVNELNQMQLEPDNPRVLLQARQAGYARTEILKISVDTINGQRVIILEDGDNGESEI